MIKYLANNLLRPTISIVVCEKETNSYVFVNGRKVSKGSTYERFFDSFPEAKEWLSDHAEKCISRAESYLQSAYDKMEVIKELKEPHQ